MATTNGHLTVIERLKHARRVSVPLVGWQCPDPAHSLQQIAAALPAETPIAAWDIQLGTWSVNEAGGAITDRCRRGPGGSDITVGNPASLLDACPSLPERSLIAMLQADAWIDDPMVRQGVWNLRDIFKSDHRQLLLMAHDLVIPPMLRNDIVLLDEPYPTEDELKTIVEAQDKLMSTCPECGGSGIEHGITCEACKGKGKSKRALLDNETMRRTVEAVSGMPAFASEQAVAMALRAKGIDLDHCWSTKKANVQQTRGLSVHRNEAKLAQLGGLGELKGYFSALMTGRKPPRVVVWIDEIGTSGVANRGDLSGVNQDQEGQLLSWMEDHSVYGVMLLGCPGTGKSQFCKAVGGQFDRLVIRLDLGAMQGSLVGESQQHVRNALRVIEAVGGDDTLWIATANSIEGLSSAMRSRYTDTFFFDLPTPEERAPIWQMWLEKFGLPASSTADVDDEGWVGRNIKQACEKAWRMNRSVNEISRYITPVAVLEAESIARMREQANNRYLDVHQPGVYRAPKSAVKLPNFGKRSVSAE